MDVRPLREACRLAVEVAVEGEEAEPRIPAPVALRPVLGFRRLSSAAYATIRRVVDADDTFRTRVAERADEAVVGRAGWLWLHRPEGWDEDPVFAGAEQPPGDDVAALRRRLARAEEQAARHKERADRAEEARKRSADRLAEVRRSAREVEAGAEDQRRRADDAIEERTRAVRSLKEVEAALADARADLRVAREATRQAESELRDLRAAAPVVAEVPTAPGPAEVAADEPPEAVAPEATAFDPAPVRDAVAAAARAAADLAGALAGVAASLAPPSAAGAAGPDRSRDRRAPDAAPASAGTVGVDGADRRRGHRRGSRRRRAAPVLPPGVFEDSGEAHHHLVHSPAVLVVVDGYNVARTAWQGLEPEEERRRTVAVLEDLAARSGGTVVVVFDGSDDAVAPPAGRAVRVRFSATGTTADDDIADLVSATPLTVPVVVVSSDRAVAEDARRQGAATMGSEAFLHACGR